MNERGLAFCPSNGCPWPKVAGSVLDEMIHQKFPASDGLNWKSHSSQNYPNLKAGYLGI